MKHVEGLRIALLVAPDEINPRGEMLANEIALEGLICFQVSCESILKINETHSSVHDDEQ
jgi:hypothetical protein